MEKKEEKNINEKAESKKDKIKKENKKKNKEELKQKKEHIKIDKKKQDKQKNEYLKKVEYYESNAKIVRPNKGKPIYEDDIKINKLITSALPYINNAPHLGTLVGCVLSADVFARFSRLLGDNVLFVCGTDEYGTATETKAIQEKCTPKEICDKYYALHSEVYEWFDCDFDVFGRTSTPAHKKMTQKIFLELKTNGFIEKKEIEQFKCPKCDIVLADRYIYGTCYHPGCGYNEARGDQCDKCGKLCNPEELINSKCKTCNTPPIKIKSFHYFLQLPKLENELKEWINKTSIEGKWSINSIRIANSFLSEGLKERCITRDLKWGVPVPSDDPDMKNKVFYVWFDAPIGYLSITSNFVGEDNWKNWWMNPNHVKLYQFMGKDNVPFHTVMFPSTIIGTRQNYTMLYHLSGTEYLNYEGIKFSKSRGIGVFGDMAKTTGIPSEVWRYYLLAVRPENGDTDFKWDDFAAKNNNELLTNLGNLINRILSFTEKNFSSKIPKFYEKEIDNEDYEFLKELTKKYKNYLNAMNNIQIKESLKIFMEISSLGNGYFQNKEPWVLVKKNSEKFNFEKAESIFYILCCFIRFIGLLSEPFMPSLSAKIYEILNIKYEGNNCILLKIINDYIEKEKEKEYLFLINVNLIEEGHSINHSKPLFKKITEEEVKRFKIKFNGSQKTSIEESK